MLLRVLIFIYIMISNDALFIYLLQFKNVIIPQTTPLIAAALAKGSSSAIHISVNIIQSYHACLRQHCHHILTCLDHK